MPGRTVKTIGFVNGSNWEIQEEWLGYLLLAHIYELKEYTDEVAAAKELFNYQNMLMIMKIEKPRTYGDYTVGTLRSRIQDYRNIDAGCVDECARLEDEGDQHARDTRTGFRQAFLRTVRSKINVVADVNQIPNAVFDRIRIDDLSGLLPFELTLALNKEYPMNRDLFPHQLKPFNPQDVGYILQYLKLSDHKRYRAWNVEDIGSNLEFKEIDAELRGNMGMDAYNHFNPSIPPPHSTTPSNLAPTPLSGPQPSCKPGNHQEGPDAYVGYKTCSVKGLTYWNLLDEALRDPHHQDRTDGLSTFQKYYTGIFDDTVAVDPEAYQDFLDHSLSADHIDISTSAEKGKIGKFFAPFTNAFDTADGAIIALVNWRDFDKAQALQWSKLMYQTWRAASAYADHEHKFGILPDHPPGGPISNLKCVVQHIVTNEGTKKVLRTMHRNRGYSINQGGVSGRNGRRGKSIIGFCAGGTDNVRGFLWLLRDYAGEMGRAMRKCRGKF